MAGAGSSIQTSKGCRSGIQRGRPLESLKTFDLPVGTIRGLRMAHEIRGVLYRSGDGEHGASQFILGTGVKRRQIDGKVRKEEEVRWKRVRLRRISGDGT